MPLASAKSLRRSRVACLNTTMQPHLKIKSTDIGKYVLLPGDPKRVDLIMQKLDNAQVIAENREYKIATGFYKKTKITICSTGIGGPSTAIAVEELISAGAKYLIRVGTCGGAWQSNIPAGSLVIPTASIRDEGTTKEYVLPEFPAVADLELTQNIIQAAKKLNYSAFSGINRCHDAFYCPEASKNKWQGLPIISSEMETAPLFVIASLRGVKAAAILAVNANPEPFNDEYKNVTEVSKNITEKTVDKAITAALEAIVHSHALL